MLNFFTLSVDEILGSERFAPAVARFLLRLMLRRQLLQLLLHISLLALFLLLQHFLTGG